MELTDQQCTHARIAVNWLKSEKWKHPGLRLINIPDLKELLYFLTAKAMRKWLERLGVREIFTTLIEAKVLIADWRREYNQVRPHSAKGYKPPAPEAKVLKTLTL